MKRVAGFTLIEIIVVVSVIGILAAIIIPNMNQGSAQARDAERRAMVSTMGAAIELYREKYGRYPEACNPDPVVPTNNGHWSGQWSGELGTDYECGDGSAEYIRNDLSSTAEVENFAPQFIPTLPKDPFRDGISSRSYVYATNPDGTVYKFMSMDGAETETVSVLDPLTRCGDLNDGSNECRSVPAQPSGNQAYNTAGDQPSQCTTVSVYENDYAVRGGYAPRGWWNVSYRGNQGISEAADRRAREYYSDQIRCK